MGKKTSKLSKGELARAERRETISESRVVVVVVVVFILAEKIVF